MNFKSERGRAGRKQKPNKARVAEPPGGAELSDSEIRALVLRITRRMSIERFVCVMMAVHDALKRGRIRQAEALGSECRLKPSRELMGAVLSAARSDDRLAALNITFWAAFHAYETTLDRARASLAVQK